MRATLLIVLGALVAMAWAVPSAGTAHFLSAGATSPANPSLPRPVHLRLSKERGLLLDTWIKRNGPYIFAVDTGAGMNLITQRVVNETRTNVRSTRLTILGGLTGARTTSNREAILNQLALGDATNTVNSTKTAVVVPALPAGVDGILDPTDIYSPYGFSIDLPNQRLEAVEFLQSEPTRSSMFESAVVRWLRVGNTSRPFVRLGDGRLALIDTGSAFGLAVNEKGAVIVGSSGRPIAGARDVAGGPITSRRVLPTTISIGELVLRRIPTDILFGVEDDAPVILGRDALYPFKITFDPNQRLIEFVASQRK